MEHVVAAQLVAHDDLLAGSGLGGEGHGGVADVGRLEEEFLRGDVGLLGRQHVVQALFLAVEERHVGVALAVLEALDDGFHHCGTLRRERELHALVLQHHVGGCALQGVVEEGGGVLFGFLLGFGSLCGSFGLLFLFCVHACHLGDGVLHEGGTLLLCRGAVEVAECYQHECNQDESCSSVFIHLSLCYVFFKVQRYKKDERWKMKEGSFFRYR